MLHHHESMNSLLGKSKWHIILLLVSITLLKEILQPAMQYKGDFSSVQQEQKISYFLSNNKIFNEQDIWLQTFAVIWILKMFFWVFPRRQIVVGRRFETLYLFQFSKAGGRLPPAFEDGTDTGFRNVGQLQFDAWEIPKRTFSIFKSRRKSEIKNCS